ncbi:hypothetical protein TNCV_4849241 [Trichonephila clavipes]|nr:hypothetical protein TNCV_4849241 [Trichonephila clavipes]
MSSRQHIDDFMRGRIIGKIEEGRKITDVAREFDIAHSVVSWLWKSYKLLECVVDGKREVVLEVRRLQNTVISSYQQKGTGAPQLSRWQISFLLPQESRSPETLLPDVWGGKFLVETILRQTGTPSSVHSQRNGINCLNSCWIMLCKVWYDVWNVASHSTVDISRVLIPFFKVPADF